MQKEPNVVLFNKKLLEKVQKELIRNGFQEVKLFDNVEDAKKEILYEVGNNKIIGVGGSQTVRTIGLLDELKSSGNKIITHSSDMDKETRIKTWLQAQQADFYFASPQAITLNGEIVLLDAYGNRVASCIYGPKKIVLICGVNKIVNNLEQAIWRARNIAAVTNNIRLQRKNPCVATGKCEDCDSKTRICNVLVIFYKKPDYSEYEIILINEDLGY